ncbi:MAG: type IV secretory system conjugative DNA transfer family protein [Acaryochloris sp. RU_4_1]|nr:type IV secretory system conjugative DNA transfer family protein [Acaryochloris sp. RU_4_1]NJR57079.1 type IV secretory system conjugative DNA transfer family protein [Acaryochloris sp. CRU_2_0]
MQTKTEQPQQQPIVDLSPLLSTPLPWMICMIGFLLILATVLDSQSGRNKRDARFATPREVRKARRRGLKQIRDRKVDECALSLGSDRKLILTDCQPGISVIGASGYGKTLSIVDPCITDALQQEMTCIIYDIKGLLQKRHAAHAHRLGYQQYFFCPGKDYTDSLNLLDFIPEHSGSKEALELAKTINANFEVPGSRKDGFFGPQGDSLLKTVFLLAKSHVYQDLVSAWGFLSLEELPQRLLAAHQYGLFDLGGDLDFWANQAALGLRSVSKAEKTAGGIVGTAVTNFQALMDASVIPAITQSSIPLDLPSKQIVWVQIDENAESTTAPLCAAVIHMLVRRNLNAEVNRDRPLFLCLDEFTSIRLPDIERWINLFREYGLCCLLSYQSDAQINLRYTRDHAMSILSSLGTSIHFRTGHPATDKSLSESLGTVTEIYKTHSRGYSRSGGSHNQSEQRQKASLITSDEINGLGRGECLIQSPGWQQRAYRLKVPVNEADVAMQKADKALWYSHVHPFLRLCHASRDHGITPERIVSERADIAESMLPTAETLDKLGKSKELSERKAEVNAICTEGGA